MVLMVFAALSWGMSFPLLKMALDEIPPISLGFIRYILAIPAIFILTLRLEGWDTMKHCIRTNWHLFAASGFLGIALPNIVQNIGMQYTTASLSGIIQATGPVFTVMLAAYLLHESLSLRKVIGAVLAIAGTVLLVTNGMQEIETGQFYGNMLLLLSAIFYAFSGIVSKLVVEKASALMICTMSILIGSLILLPLSLYEGLLNISQPSTSVMWAMFILILLPTVIAYYIWFHSLKDEELSRLVYFVYLIPIFAVIFSYILLGEVITIISAISALIIVAGVAIVQHERVDAGTE
jgi:drug/metabolite transporter (DMT)-like permease